MILVSREGENKNVGMITLNRPKALNALCSPLMTEVAQALTEFEADSAIGSSIVFC
jgi:enoyl-CoA hydratase/carnithine racemase